MTCLDLAGLWSDDTVSTAMYFGFLAVLAVDTVSSDQSPAKSKQVMIYDTESKQIVGNSVYNLGRQPEPGSTAKYDMMTAQYVGR